MFKCLLCDKTFNTVVEARNHIIKDHNAKQNIDEFIEYVIPINIEKLEEELIQNFDCCMALNCVEINIEHKPIYPVIKIEITDCRIDVSIKLVECIIKSVVPILKKYGIPEDKMLVKEISNIIQPEEYCPSIVISIDTKGVWDR